MEQAIATQTTKDTPLARAPGLLVLALYALLFLILAYGGFLFTVRGIQEMPGSYMRDFLGIYIGERMIVENGGSQLYDLAAQMRMQDQIVAPYTNVPVYLYIYPAYVGLAFVPLGLLAYVDALTALTILNLILTALVLWKLSQVSATSGMERLTLVLAAGSFTPLWRVLWQGQLSLWPTLALCGALLSLRSGQQKWAGAWLLLGAVKPQLMILPLLLLAMERRWRALALWSVGMAALMIVSLLLFGNWLPSYADLLLNAQQQPSQAGDIGDIPALMQNWRGLLYGLLGGESSGLSTFLNGLLIALSIIVVLMIGWSHPCLGRANSEVRFAVAVLLGLLIVPHLYTHDTVLALLPGFILWRASAAALAAHPAQKTILKMRILRLALGAAPIALLAGQLLPAGSVQVFPWYTILILLLVFWGWNSFHATAELETPEHSPQLAITNASR